jgi:hypothetical protein
MPERRPGRRASIRVLAAILTRPAGSPFLIPPRTPHNALDVGPETGQMLSAYIVEVGPLATSTE